jgi:hypothetical protein
VSRTKAYRSRTVGEVLDMRRDRAALRASDNALILYDRPASYRKKRRFAIVSADSKVVHDYLLRPSQRRELLAMGVDVRRAKQRHGAA